MVFSHAQDMPMPMASFEAHRGMYLGFFSGGIFPDDSRDARVARRTVRALRKRGLHPVWDGSVSQRIWVPLRGFRRPFDLRQTQC
mmetsp:Transcript_28407/g.92784  ORF Transcript_28407/g.92784 Transcript_28407/m.92784 type:complete len:85 (+) Transcript_28407:628-882(+)